MSVASARERALDLAQRLRAIGPVAVSRFFGGAGLTKDGVQFAFIVEGVLYLRVDEQSRPDFQALSARPFAYASGSKTVTVASYYALPEEILDDDHALLRWATRAVHAAATARQGKPRATS